MAPEGAPATGDAVTGEVVGGGPSGSRRSALAERSRRSRESPSGDAAGATEPPAR